MIPQDQIIALVSDASKLPELEKFIKLANKMKAQISIDLLSISNEYLQNLITISILHNNLAATELLIEAGVNVNHGDMMGITPLLTAVFMDNISAVDLLIASNADLNQTDLNIGNAGFELDGSASDEQADALKKYENNKNTSSDKSYVAFENYYVEEQEKISTSRNSPLKIACFLGRKIIFDRLLAAGAVVTASVVEAAVRTHQDDILKVLREHTNEDEINESNIDDMTVLEVALCMDNLKALERFFDYNVEAVSSWCFTDDKTYSKKANGYYNEWSIGLSSSVKELYLARTIKEYLTVCLSEEEPAGENMINFHFNHNTELFCDFVKYQLTLPEETPDKNTQFVRLQAATLTELFKRILILTADEKIGNPSEFMPLPERQKRLAELHLAIGDFLYGQEHPAAYLYYANVSNPAGEKMAAEMLYQEIMLQRGEPDKGIKPERTRQSLQQQYPNEYAQAGASLTQKGHAFLIPEEEEPESPATVRERDEKVLVASVLHSPEKTKAAGVSETPAGESKASKQLKRHGSLFFGDENMYSLQSPTKSARSHSREITLSVVNENLQPQSTPVLQG